MPVYRQTTGASHNIGHKSASTPLYCRYCGYAPTRCVQCLNLSKDYRGRNEDAASCGKKKENERRNNGKKDEDW